MRHENVGGTGPCAELLQLQCNVKQIFAGIREFEYIHSLSHSSFDKPIYRNAVLDHKSAK